MTDSFFRPFLPSPLHTFFPLNPVMGPKWFAINLSLPPPKRRHLVLFPLFLGIRTCLVFFHPPFSLSTSAPNVYTIHRMAIKNTPTVSSHISPLCIELFPLSQEFFFMEFLFSLPFLPPLSSLPSHNSHSLFPLSHPHAHSSSSPSFFPFCDTTRCIRYDSQTFFFFKRNRTNSPSSLLCDLYELPFFLLLESLPIYPVVLKSSCIPPSTLRIFPFFHANLSSSCKSNPAVSPFFSFPHLYHPK